MSSQGSATQSDGPPQGDTSSYPTMADRSEIGRRGSLAQRERKEDWRAEQPEEKGTVVVTGLICKTGYGQLHPCTRFCLGSSK